MLSFDTSSDTLVEGQRLDDSPGTGLLEVAAAASRSVVRRAYATSPLRLLTPRNHGRAAWVYTSSYGGGLVGGDVVRVRLRVGCRAAAFVSTQASTKVYRSETGTRTELTATVGAGGQLVVWPDPVVCFADSTYRQQQEISLEAGALLVLVDWVTSGRRAAGERWRFRHYSNRLTVRYDGRLVLVDSMALGADDGDLPRRMGRFDVLCSAVVVGDQLRAERDRIVADVSSLAIERRADLLQAAAPVSDVGCILRLAGRSVEQIARVLRQHLSFVPGLLGDDPWSRKW